MARLWFCKGCAAIEVSYLLTLYFCPCAGLSVLVLVWACVSILVCVRCIEVSDTYINFYKWMHVFVVVSRLLMVAKACVVRAL